MNDLNNGQTPGSLAASLAGSGVTVSNVTYTGDNRAAGAFTGGAGSIGFASGIVLDSGAVQTYPTDPPCSRGVEGPNGCYENGGPNGQANSTAFGTPGDPQLDSLSGFQTFDASVLQFDVVPTQSVLTFNFVFGSEEYSDFSNTSFNDVFGFFVDGTNCALVPGTSQPISVNTINNGNDAGGDPTPQNPQYFRDNVRPAPTLDTELDGLTTVLTCTAAVTPGVANHIKLAIADASDTVLDSAVFIQAGSLVSGTGVSTTLSGGGQSGQTISVPSGTAVSDQATLTGASTGSATGTVTYNVYSDAACSTLYSSAGTKSVSGGSVPASDPVTITAAGTYYWQASYSGDASHNAASSPCGSEVLTVTGSSDAPISATGLTRNWPRGCEAVARFTDPDTTAAPSEYAATVNWGDGRMSSEARIIQTGPGAFLVRACHAYSAHGTHSASVTITDVDNASNSATVSSTLTS